MIRGKRVNFEILIVEVLRILSTSIAIFAIYICSEAILKAVESIVRQKDLLSVLPRLYVATYALTLCVPIAN